MKNLIDEFLLTLSNKKSLLSSKRIERFAVFSIMLASTIGYVITHLIKCSMTSTDLMLVVGGWLSYAGFNTLQIKKDKQNETENQ
jgi:hypothetical protein